MKKLTRVIFFSVYLFFYCKILNCIANLFLTCRKKGSTKELIVDGKPFLVLGGELGNSTASSFEYMRPFWTKFKAMNLNTILVPAYWDLIEPEEGKFDFSLVDSIRNSSRKNNLKVILLRHTRIPFGDWNIQKVKLYQYK